jgi:hypothetical protein
LEYFNIYIKINQLKIVIKGYYEFLLESVLMTSQYLEDVIKNIDDKIAQDFIQLINQDIKTPYNALNITDRNDKVSFLADNQFQNKIKAGSNPLDLFSDTNNKTTAGRVVRQILKDNGKEYTDVEISKFVDKFKASWEKLKSKDSEKSPIRVVSGEELRSWYHEEHYNERTLRGYGSLGKSCMRHDECQQFLDIYAFNPEVCKLLINTKEENGEEKLVSRAILWTTNKGLYLDRIYYTDSSEEELLMDWAKTNLGCELFFRDSGGKKFVQLENPTKMYDKYPYMDSMPYYYTVERKVYNYEPSVDNKAELLYCQDTDGYYERQNMVYCEWTDDNLPEDEVIWSSYHNSYLPSNRSEWSEYLDSYLYDREAVYSVILRDNIAKDDSIKVIIDDAGIEDWLPKDNDLIARDANSGDWYLIKLMKEIDGSWYYKDSLKKAYVVRESDIPKYKEIFSIDESVDNYDCIASYDVLSFYKLGMKDDSMEYVLLEDYYKKVYMNVDFQSMYDSLEDNEKSDDVIEELENANLTLRERNNFYTYNNYVIKLGGFDKVIEKYKELLDTVPSGKDKTTFELSFDGAIRNYRDHVQHDLLKSTVKKVLEEGLIDFAKGCDGLGNKDIKYYMNKLSKFEKLFKTIFTKYNDEDEIRYYFDITSATMYFTTQGNGNWYSGDDIRYLRCVDYFTKNPNKLPTK